MPIKIGSHVSMSGDKMYLASIEEALSYEANALMIYTGAPQNTIRKKIEDSPKNPRYIVTVWGTGYKFEEN